MSDTHTPEAGSGLNPTTEDFAALLDENGGGDVFQEGAVIKGTVIAIEKDFTISTPVFSTGRWRMT